MSSNNDFVNTAIERVIPNGYKLVSFDAKSLFTCMPLDYTIDVILKRIYEKHEILTNIGRKQLKELILLCIKIFPSRLVARHINRQKVRQWVHLWNLLL